MLVGVVIILAVFAALSGVRAAECGRGEFLLLPAPRSAHGKRSALQSERDDSGFKLTAARGRSTRHVEEEGCHGNHYGPGRVREVRAHHRPEPRRLRQVGTDEQGNNFGLRHSVALGLDSFGQRTTFLAMPKLPPSPKDKLKIRSRFKPGQEVLIRAKITQIRADAFGKPQLVVSIPNALAPVRVREGDAEPTE